MRTLPVSLLTVSVLLAGACSRPVLYYPAPQPAPAQPVLAGEPSKAASAGDASASAEAMSAELVYLRDRHIVIPVAGAPMDSVMNSFDEARDGGERVHHAVDILAPRGTPILSADDGRILRLSNNKLGGISLYAEDAGGKLVYYYAHMERYADDMAAGRQLAKGDTIGFVGTTGNAPKNVPHLHFQVMRMPADGKYWNGEPINPFAVLVGAEHATHTAAQPD